LNVDRNCKNDMFHDYKCITLAYVMIFLKTASGWNLWWNLWLVVIYLTVSHFAKIENCLADFIFIWNDTVMYEVCYPNRILFSVLSSFFKLVFITTTKFCTFDSVSWHDVFDTTVSNNMYWWLPRENIGSFLWTYSGIIHK
jgi:hypothetical protein